jgi:hypothetical protein
MNGPAILAGPFRIIMDGKFQTEERWIMRLKPDDVLRSVAHRNRAAAVEERAEGLLVTVPMRQPWWTRGPVRWVFPFRDERKVQLDAAGSFVFSLCDGRRTVEKMIEKMMERHSLSFQEARASVCQFLKMLAERGVVAIEVPKSEGPSAP